MYFLNVKRNSTCSMYNGVEFRFYFDMYTCTNYSLFGKQPNPLNWLGYMSSSDFMFIDFGILELISYIVVYFLDPQLTVIRFNLQQSLRHNMIGPDE